MYKYIAWRDGELLGERLVVLGPRRSASMPSISKRAFSPRAFEVESVLMASACGGVPAKRFRGVKKLSFWLKTNFTLLFLTLKPRPLARGGIGTQAHSSSRQTRNTL